MSQIEKRILMLVVSILISMFAELNRKGMIVPSVTTGNAVIDLKNEVDDYMGM